MNHEKLFCKVCCLKSHENFLPEIYPNGQKKMYKYKSFSWPCFTPMGSYHVLCTCFKTDLSKFLTFRTPYKNYWKNKCFRFSSSFMWLKITKSNEIIVVAKFLIISSKSITYTGQQAKWKVWNGFKTLHCLDFLQEFLWFDW